MMSARCDPCTIFELPAAIRLKIYQDAGLPVQEPVQVPTKQWWGFPYDTQLSTRLMQTCVTFHKEVMSVFYSTNQFVVDFRNPRGRAFLLNLRETTVRHLRHLVINFNNDLCSKFGDGCYTECRGSNMRAPLPGASWLKDVPDIFKDCSQGVEEILPTWIAEISRLSLHGKTANIHLFLTCDNVQLATAEHLMGPILKHMETNKLASCSIRLGQKKDPSLIQLAKHVVKTVTMPIPPRSGTLNYLGLPSEIREMILMYTDLVTPLVEVSWNPSLKYFITYGDHEPCDEDYCGWWTEHLHYACQFRWCSEFTCRTYGRRRYKNYEDLSTRAKERRLSKSTGCFCDRYHSVSTSLWSTCTCWKPPIALFLVCKTMKDEAEKIFFTSNRFIITPTEGCSTPPTANPTRLEVSIFVKSMRASALHALRDLEIVFPPFEMHYCDFRSPIWWDWVQSLRLLISRIDSRKLSLCIWFADVSEHDALISGERDAFYGIRLNMTKEQRKHIMKTYWYITGPLGSHESLKQLNHFYIRVANPAQRLNVFDRRSVDEEIARSNQFGRKIMGEDYEYLSAGRDKRRNSQWVEHATFEPG